MAEFKLGRIRFVWKGTWSTGRTYYQDDVVTVGGRMYICTIGHESDADFYNDFDIVPPKWNLVSDGQAWKGNWSPNTAYIYNDIVKYGSGSQANAFLHAPSVQCCSLTLHITRT